MPPDELHALVRAAKRRPLFTPGPSSQPVAYGRGDIERILPHRAPFLFIDRIEAIDLEQSAVLGRRWIDPADPVFVGHFPAHPVYPAVLQVEAIGQLGICAAYFTTKATHAISLDAAPLNVRATRVHHGLFQAEVQPGDDITVLACLLAADEYMATCAGQILKGETVCTVAIMEVCFVES